MKFLPSCLLLVASASAFAPISIPQTSIQTTPKSKAIHNHAWMTSSSLRMSDTISTTNDKTPTAKTDYDLLSLPARGGRPLKVAIAGGGVGGLTTALYMLKKGFDVTVYEKTAAFARFGGPIQFASNALSVLKEIDEELFDRVMEKFTFTGTRTCGIKDGLRADGSFRMTDDSLDYLVNPDAPADWFVKFPLRQCADLFGLPYTGVIDRPDLQEILIDECRKIKPDFIQNGNGVTGYESHGRGNGVTVKLADGSNASADLLVGSDGIWSSVRAQMYNEEIKGTSKDLKTRQGNKYSGYTVFAGETILTTPDYYETGYKVYIGPQRYFVTSDVGGGRIQWYAFFALPPGSKKAPSGWGGSVRDEQSDPEENLVDYIKNLHEGWTDEVMTVLDATSPDSVEQRDLYDRPPELLRSWADGNVVLCGDAVHPMMPNLGQGGCQAIEDAYILTEILAQTKNTGKIEENLQEFYRKRIVRVSVVQFMSRLASDLIINAFDTPWSPHDNKGQSWKSYLTFAWKVRMNLNTIMPIIDMMYTIRKMHYSDTLSLFLIQPLLQYIIFPAQFAYLYSYYPSGNMEELPAELEKVWKTRHFEVAEKAFKDVASGKEMESGPSFFQKAEVEETVQV